MDLFFRHLSGNWIYLFEAPGGNRIYFSGTGRQPPPSQPVTKPLTRRVDSGTMPVLHDKQMPGPVWTKVAPGKWREVAPANSPSAADDAAGQSAKRARTLTLNKNRLDFLKHADHDAYVYLMRHFVGTGVAEFHDSHFRLNDVGGWLYNPWVDCRSINICGLKYLVTTTATRAYIPKWCDKFFEKQHLLAAAEANGIRVFKSWTKPRLWKALLSV